jgi:hypothetical protein
MTATGSASQNGSIRQCGFPSRITHDYKWSWFPRHLTLDLLNYHSEPLGSRYGALPINMNPCGYLRKVAHRRPYVLRIDTHIEKHQLGGWQHWQPLVMLVSTTLGNRKLWLCYEIQISQVPSEIALTTRRITRDLLPIWQYKVSFEPLLSWFMKLLL